MSKKSRVRIITFIIFSIISFTLTFLTSYFIGVKITKLEVLKRLAPLLGALAILIIILYACIDERLRGSKRVLKVNADLENSHFLTEKEIECNDGFLVTSFKNLQNVSDGILVRAERGKHSNVNIVLKQPPIHTLVIGATGTGKTSAYISPKIEILARTKTKPSLILTDPKGELFNQHAQTLKRQGYDVAVIDLADPFHSTRWNPLSDIILKTEQLLKLKVVCQLGKYTVGSKEYTSFTAGEEARKALVKEIENEIYIDLQDFIFTMCPVEKSQDTSWELGARNFIFGITYAFWEDLRDGLMHESEFTLFNLYRTISNYAKGDCEELKAYIDTRSPSSPVRGLTNTVLVSKDRTLASYLGTVNAYITWLADKGITTLTSGSDIEFTAMDEQPTAVFLKIPDEKENRYKLASIFTAQLYKALVYKATQNMLQAKTSSQKLLRNVYFLLDEFGNMPKLNNLDKIVTVGRSRGIFFVPVIQDFNQLEEKYGKTISATVRSNCNIQIFIGTTDENTRKIFAEQCGKKRVKQVSYSESKDMSISTSATSVPLIYPSELERLNDTANGEFGNIIVLSLGNYPLKSVITPYFKCKDIYVKSDSQDIATSEEKPFNDFNEEVMNYSIERVTNYLNVLEDLDAELDSNEDGKTQNSNDFEEEVAQPPPKEKTPIERWQDLMYQKIEGLRLRLDAENFEKLCSAIGQADVDKFMLIIDELVSKATSKFMIIDLLRLKIYPLGYSKEEKGAISNDKN